MTRGEIWLVDFGVPSVNKFALIEKMSVMPKSYMKKISAGIIKVLELKEGM
ncbi:MAG: hypothetical protein ACI4MA_01735 [Treponema sp.]